MILKHADDKQPDIDILHNLAAQANSPRQRQSVQEEIDNIVTGMRGEQDASYYLDQEFRHRDDSVVIHDLRIEEEGDVAQIDHVVISRNRQAFVLETKALKASLECNSAGEWEAVYGRERYSIPSPLEQCKRHAAVLRRWLGRRETAIREVVPVVLVAPTTKLGQRASAHDDPDMIKSDLFTRWFEQRSTTSTNQVVQRGNERMSEDELAGVGFRLVRAHTPIQFDWRRRFGFPSAKAEEDAPPRLIAVAPPSEEPVGPTEGGGRRRHIGKAEVPIRGGSIFVFRYENGDRAIRCDDDSLKRRVSELCRLHHGRWAPYPKFWLVSLEACKAIIEQLGGQPVTVKPTTSPPYPADRMDVPTPERLAPQNAQGPASHTPTTNTAPGTYQTSKGSIRIASLGDGRFTVRCDPEPSLIEIVRSSCSGIGRWNPRYRNWLIEPSRIEEIRVAISQKTAEIA